MMMMMFNPIYGVLNDRNKQSCKSENLATCYSIFSS